MKKLSEWDTYLEISLNLLNEFLTGDCCEHARMHALSIALNDLFEDLEIDIATEQEIEKNPKKYYNELRKIILNDTSLNPSRKIELIRILD